MTTILIHPVANHLIWVCSPGDPDSDDAPESFVFNKKTGERFPVDVRSEPETRAAFLEAGWVRAYIPEINLTMNGQVLQNMVINNF